MLWDGCSGRGPGVVVAWRKAAGILPAVGLGVQQHAPAGEDRSDRYLSFSLPRLESAIARCHVDGLTFDLWRRAWVGCRVGWGIRELPLPGD